MRPNPASIYLCTVNKRNTRAKFEIYSKLTIKTPKRRSWRRFGVFIVNFLPCTSVSIVNFENVIASCKGKYTAQKRKVFQEEIFNGKLHFLCSDKFEIIQPMSCQCSHWFKYSLEFRSNYSRNSLMAYDHLTQYIGKKSREFIFS